MVKKLIGKITHYFDKENGAAFMGMVRSADLIVILHENKRDLSLVNNELKEAEVNNKRMVISKSEDNVENKIWKNLNLIYVYTKSPGKKKDYPPVALKKKSTVKDLTFKVHKDFFNNFDYARIWGPSAKHPGMRVGLEHILKKDDVVEIHIK